MTKTKLKAFENNPRQITAKEAELNASLQKYEVV
jgi:hypothetical protein